MKKVSMLIFMIVLFGLTGNSVATSPMPEEVQRSQSLCVVRIIHSPDIGRGIPGEETSSTLSFDDSVSKKDVLERTTVFIDNEVNWEGVSAIKIDCRFVR